MNALNTYVFCYVSMDHNRENVFSVIAPRRNLVYSSNIPAIFQNSSWNAQYFACPAI